MEKKKKTKVTQAHFETFKKHCLFFQKELGLMRYRIYFELKEMQSFAQAEISQENCWIKLTLTKKWDSESEPLNDTNLKITALHEMIHVLLDPLEELVRNRFITEEQIRATNEQITASLENFLKDKI